MTNTNILDNPTSELPAAYDHYSQVQIENRFVLPEDRQNLVVNDDMDSSLSKVTCILPILDKVIKHGPTSVLHVTQKHGRYHFTSRYKSSVLKMLSFHLPEFWDQFRFTLAFEVFRKHSQILGVNEHSLMLPYSIEYGVDPISGPYLPDCLLRVLYELFHRIHKEAQSEQYKKKAKQLRANGQRNERKVRLGIDNFFDRFSEGEVIRIDLYLKGEFAHTTTLDEVRTYLSKFLNNQRNNKIFEGQEFYLWKIEVGFSRGIHIHLLVILQARLKRNAAFHAQRMCDYWADNITKGKGWAHNCNKSAATYKHLGIGNVHASDTEKRENLMAAATYFCKSIQHLGLSNERVFGGSQLKPIPVKKPGRPRKQ